MIIWSVFIRFLNTIGFYGALRPSSICVHCKSKPTKKFIDFIKNFFILNFFLNWIEIKFWWRQIFKILIIHKLPSGNVRSHTKFGPDRQSEYIRRKELSLWNNINYLNLNIFKTRCCKPLIFQTQIILSNRIHSLKYLVPKI